MQDITLKQFKEAFEIGAARKVTVVGEAADIWYATFQTDDPLGGSQGFRLALQRGGHRTWSDPRRLFNFLRSLGVTGGEFQLLFKPDE